MLIYTCTSKSVTAKARFTFILGDTAHHFHGRWETVIKFCETRNLVCVYPMPIIPVAPFFFSSTPEELVMCASVRLRATLIDHLSCQYPN